MGYWPILLLPVCWENHHRNTFYEDRLFSFVGKVTTFMFQTSAFTIVKYIGLALGIVISLIFTSRWNHITEPSLVQAIRERQPTLAKELLEKGAEVNAKTPDGGTPLHYAAESGQYGLTLLLLQHGADVNARFKTDWTPLHFAAKRGHVDIADLLLRHGAQVNGLEGQATPLHLAVQERQRRMVAFLLAHGATVNSRFKEGWTALHLAAQTGDADVTRLLLDAGAPINATNILGITPLHSAAFSGHKDLTKYLLTRGAQCTLPTQAVAGLSAKNLSVLYSSLQELVQGCPDSLHS